SLRRESWGSRKTDTILRSRAPPPAAPARNPGGQRPGQRAPQYPEKAQHMTRAVLCLLTNLAVMLVLRATLRIFGVDRYLAQGGLDVQALLIFSLIVGFTGSIISLLMSKPMAKWSTGARVIDPQAPANAREAWLVET